MDSITFFQVVANSLLTRKCFLKTQLRALNTLGRSTGNLNARLTFPAPDAVVMENVFTSSVGPINLSNMLHVKLS